MKKLFSLAAVLLVSAKVAAATVHVPGDYSSVYEAWDHVVSGDTIKIAAGDHREPEGWGTWDHTGHMVPGVTVEGSGWWNTRVNITSSSSMGYVGIIANEANCVFRDFYLWTDSSTHLIDIYAAGVVLDRMVIRPTKSGICVAPEAEAVVSNVAVVGTGTRTNGAFLAETSGAPATITNCLVVDMPYGLKGPFPHSHVAFYDVTTPYENGAIPDPTDLPPLAENPLNADYTTKSLAPIIDAGDPDVIDSYDGTRSDIGPGYAQRVCKLGWTPEIDRVPTLGHPAEEVFCPGKQFTLYYQDLKALYPPLDGSVDVQKFVVLDVYGGYYFWPDWTTETGWVDRPIFDGYDQSGTILDFTWPQFDGEAHGLAIWAALWNPTDPQPPMISGLQFGYTSECP